MKFLPQIICTCTALLLSACLPDVNSNQPVNKNNFTLLQPMDQDESGFWNIADGWSNGLPFLNGWCNTQVAFVDSKMQLSLDNLPCAGENTAGAEYRSNDFYGYGYFEVRMKAANGNGVVSSFFTYTGPSDGNVHDEIDFEILGNDTTRLQVNYWVNGVEHPQFITLGFDAAADYHTYAFDWRADGIKWYVDGVLVHSVTSTDGTLPTTPGRIVSNIWACDATIWCGQFTVDQLPAQASYDWIGYRP